MTLSELSTATGVPVATVKYYLREGLLPPGERRSATRSDYGPAHVERLDLVRALVDGAGLRLDAVRRVVAALEDPPHSWHELLGVAQAAIDGPAPEVAVAPETRDVVSRLGWSDCSPERLTHLQGALDTAARAGVPVSPSRLEAYARAMTEVAVADLDGFADDPARGRPEGAVHYVAVGTVATDPVLVALRRMAQEHESEQRYAAKPVPQTPHPALGGVRRPSAGHPRTHRPG